MRRSALGRLACAGLVWLSGAVLSAADDAPKPVATDNQMLHKYVWSTIGLDGAIGATLSGPDVYPSAAYIPFSTTGPTGPAQVAGAGVGPNDGFTATFDGGYRTRWGDYGAAAVSPDGTVWFGAEYIAQTCGFDEFSVDSTCGFTRTFFANWSTRVFAVKP